MEPALVYHLQRVPWQWFVTLTFHDEQRPHWTPPAGKKIAAFFSWSRDVARWHHVHWKKELRWVLRAERGERTAREHLHALIGGLPVGALTDKSRFAASRYWKRFGGGHADVRCFDAKVEDGSYLFKPETVAGANAYESAKFGSADCRVMVSHSVWHYLASRRGVDPEKLVGICGGGKDPAREVPAGLYLRNPLAHSHDSTPLTKTRS